MIIMPMKIKKKKKSIKRSNKDFENEKDSISEEEIDNDIRKIFNLTESEDLPMVTDETLEIYFKYLHEELNLPFDVKYSDDFGFWAEKIYDITIKRVLPYGVSGDNEFYGLFCEAREGRRKISCH